MAADDIDRLIRVFEEIAAGRYSHDVMPLTRPGRPEPVRRIAGALGMMMDRVEERELHLEHLLGELRELNRRLQENAVKTVSAIASALSARDRYTAGHAERVAHYAVAIARRRGLPEPEVEHIRIGATLHDIGKISFSDRVFSNEDIDLSPDLLAEIRQHPRNGEEILKGLDFLGPALAYARCHHERLDGSGYPDGLRGDAIPVGAQVIAVADCFDAMTSDRPYQEGRTPEQALAVMRNVSGTHLAGDLVELLAAEIRENGTYPGAWSAP